MAGAGQTADRAAAQAPAQAPARTVLARASVPDTLRVAATVLTPLVARGVILRRPRVVALAARADADRRAVRLLRRLRDRYGPGPLPLRIPGRSVALVLSHDDVLRVLDGTPEPFATANREKRGALSHFQPHGVLISHGAERADRRRFNEAVLDTDRPVHRLADALAAVVDEEAGRLLAAGHLCWDDLARVWWRMVRRVVLGYGAADDTELTDLLKGLRSDANWAYLKPRRHGRRERFLRRLDGHLRRAEPGSLAELVAATPSSELTAPDQQVPQWLFAFDAAGMATWRALGLLATHPEHAALARAEAADLDSGAPRDLPYLRACVLESVRLWPTTPVVLRDTTTATEWAGGVLPAGTALAIVVPYFDRDPDVVPDADRFAPRRWLDPDRGAPRSVVPFSAGPAVCAGRNLVLYVTSTFLARLIAGHAFRLTSGQRLDPARPLPGTLDPFRLEFDVTTG